MKRLEIYLAGVSLLAVSLYIKSPMVACSAVVLWGLSSAEIVLQRKNRDADIAGLVAKSEAYEKKLKELELDVNNVAERAQTILGDTYR